MRAPRYDGTSLVNLLAELEHRLTGASDSPLLEAGSLIPDGRTYVLVLFDGLGAHQLHHPAAGSLLRSQRAILDAPFPSTTTVSLATVATGHAPIRHGVMGHQIWEPDLGTVVNALKWTTPGGTPVELDFDGFLPSPNLWERLTAAGAEPITVQPGHFSGSALSRVLYRGCRYEGVWSDREVVEATVDLARRPNRLIFVYVPQLDIAAHMAGLDSDGYTTAMKVVARVWEDLTRRLGDDASLIGTSDHGHIDYADDAKREVKRPPSVRLFGDPRVLYVRGHADELGDLPAEAVEPAELRRLWGAGHGPVHPDLKRRSPDVAFLADRGRLLLPSSMDDRWIGYHGGLEPEELEIPLLIR